jgi:hypothetical protein
MRAATWGGEIFWQMRIQQKLSIFVTKYIDLSSYWTEDKNTSIQKAKEMTGLDKRTLSSAKKGQLDRGHFETLFKLRDSV